jgi:hypothetical protein
MKDEKEAMNDATRMQRGWLIHPSYFTLHPSCL